MYGTDSKIEIRYLQNTSKDYNDFLEVLNSFRACELSFEDFDYIRGNRDDSNIIHTFVAEMDGRLVGTATIIVEPKFIHNGGFVGHIEDVVVLPAYRQLGVGRALVEHVASVAGYLDCYKVILNCASHNVPFYEKCGFHQDGNHMRKDVEPI